MAAPSRDSRNRPSFVETPWASAMDDAESHTTASAAARDQTDETTIGRQSRLKRDAWIQRQYYGLMRQ